MTPIKLKRIYEAREESDGFRVLADRLWPRGIKKEDAGIDLWAKDIAPTNELRKWYHANMDQYDAFYNKFMQELDENPESLEFLKTVKSKPVVCLLTAAKDIPKSHLGVLKDFIERK